MIFYLKILLVGYKEDKWRVKMDSSTERVIPMVKLLSEIIEKKANGELKKYDITIGQVRVLAILYYSEQKECSLKELERIFHTSQATIAGIVSRLENKKFLVGVSDVQDRRIKKVRLTKAGEDLAKNAQVKVNDMEKWLTSNLEKEEREELIRLLYKMYDTIE